MQPAGRPADQDSAHATAQSHVDHLLLRRTAYDANAIFGRRKTHHRIERLEVNFSFGIDDRELVDWQIRQPLRDPAIGTGEPLLDRLVPLWLREQMAE